MLVSRIRRAFMLLVMVLLWLPFLCALVDDGGNCDRCQAFAGAIHTYIYMYMHIQ